MDKRNLDQDEIVPRIPLDIHGGAWFVRPSSAHLNSYSKRGFKNLMDRH